MLCVCASRLYVRYVPAGMLCVPSHHSKHWRGGGHDGGRGDAGRSLQRGETLCRNLLCHRHVPRNKGSLSLWTVSVALSTWSEAARDFDMRLGARVVSGLSVWVWGIWKDWTDARSAGKLTSPWRVGNGWAFMSRSTDLWAIKAFFLFSLREKLQ